MATDMEQLYAERLARYTTAMRNGKPDKVPIRPFVAEFTAKYAGFTCQEVTHDYDKAFIAARKCAADFDWDAVVGNMVYVWTGLTQAIGLKYYGVPGIDIPPDTGFQYREPDEDHAFMKADEYDALIDDPTAFLYNVWLPRVSADIIGEECPLSQDWERAGVRENGLHSTYGSKHSPRSHPETTLTPSPLSRRCAPLSRNASPNNRRGGSYYRNNLALVKGGMAMMQYFGAFGPQGQLLRTESGTVGAIAGILKAPFDILADKLRGYIGLTMDMMTQPDKVLAACQALMPHLYNVALTSADPNKQAPIGFWMHRGCAPFVSKGQFESHYWPTVKPIIEELWRNGHQTLFYAEGDWNAHLDHFAELPDASIIYHVDRGDIFEVYRRLGHKFCLSGGIPNFLLAYGTPGQVRERCKAVIDGVARDGGYIMDASAIMQNDTSAENLRAMTDFTREYGVYSAGSAGILPASPGSQRDAGATCRQDAGATQPGVCIPWEEKVKELPNPIPGDADLARRVWEQVDSLGNMFIWQLLESF